jgi:hypothetical protein
LKNGRETFFFKKKVCPANLSAHDLSKKKWAGNFFFSKKTFLAIDGEKKKSRRGGTAQFPQK